MTTKQKDFIEAWRTYAAAAIQGLGADRDRNHPITALCHDAVAIADEMMRLQEERIKQFNNGD